MRYVCLWWLLTVAPAFGQGIEALPDTVVVAFRTNPLPFDTVLLANRSADTVRVDSITIRLLDGGANPRPEDFTACKTCPPDSAGRYIYGGWVYGYPDLYPLRYLRDSLFLIQDQKGVPVAFSIGPGASHPFALNIPVNCPVCGRMPSFPGASRYAFTFISSEGGRAVLDIQVTRPTGISGKRTSPRTSRPEAADDAAKARDAAGRKAKSGPAPGIRFRKPSG
jgi:hypothetical protein